MVKTFIRILDVLKLIEEGADIDAAVLQKRWGVSRKTVGRTVKNAKGIHGWLKSRRISIRFRT